VPGALHYNKLLLDIVDHLIEVRTKAKTSHTPRRTDYVALAGDNYCTVECSIGGEQREQPNRQKKLPAAQYS
jgi:hypothetical protein